MMTTEIMPGLIILCAILDLFRWGNENQYKSRFAAKVELVRQFIAYEVHE